MGSVVILNIFFVLFTYTFHNHENAHIAVGDDCGWNDKAEKEHIQNVGCCVRRAYFPIHGAAENKRNSLSSKTENDKSEIRTK